MVELLVVIAIISLLISILLPTLSKARDKAETAVCMNNMKQIGIAISNYVSDHDGYYPHSGKNHISYDDRISGYDGRPALDPNSASPATGMQARALGYVEHGQAKVYQCPSYPNPDSLYERGLKALPRSYAMNRYDPGHLHRGTAWLPNYALGMAGMDKRGSTVLRGSVTVRQDSSTPDQNHRPSRSILLIERNFWGSGFSNEKLGTVSGASTAGAFWRNGKASGPTWHTSAGSHAEGRLDNFLMADGHVETLDFRDTTTRLDGSWIFAGGDWRDTMWDARLGK